MKKTSIKNLRFRVRESDRIKTPHYAYLKLNRNLELELILPKNVRANPEEIISKKRGWILQKAKEFAHNKLIFRNNGLLYKGKTYKLLFKKHREASLSFDNDKIVIKDKRKSEVLNHIEKWMKKQSRELVLDLVNRYSELMEMKANKIYFRRSKKWGSNSTKGNISFNWQIIGLPQKLIEYVVIHELAHLKEFKHDDRFWKLISNHCLDYLEREKALKKYTTVQIH